MTITVDEGSGCCNGVRRAIKTAEEYLKRHERLYCLGSIVHNTAETARLSAKGMTIIDEDDFTRLQNTTVLIRAHGEPPSTYETARKNGLSLVDCTCPVVLKLHKRIAAAYREMHSKNGQVLIFGKKGHAEVNGLVGQTDGNATVIESIESLEEIIRNGELDTACPTVIFSQTTKSPDEYEKITSRLSRLIPDLTVHDTICRQVSSRLTSIRAFAASHDVILFVCGEESSNGKILFGHCSEVNPRSYKIDSAECLKREWFKPSDSVGICGATSTPMHQLEKIKRHLDNYFCRKNTSIGHPE